MLFSPEINQKVQTEVNPRHYPHLENITEAALSWPEAKNNRSKSCFYFFSSSPSVNIACKPGPCLRWREKVQKPRCVMGRRCPFVVCGALRHGRTSKSLLHVQCLIAVFDKQWHFTMIAVWGIFILCFVDVIRPLNNLNNVTWLTTLTLKEKMKVALGAY